MRFARRDRSSDALPEEAGFPAGRETLISASDGSAPVDAPDSLFQIEPVHGADVAEGVDRFLSGGLLYHGDAEFPFVHFREQGAIFQRCRGVFSAGKITAHFRFRKIRGGGDDDPSGGVDDGFFLHIVFAVAGGAELLDQFGQGDVDGTDPCSASVPRGDSGGTGNDQSEIGNAVGIGFGPGGSAVGVVHGDPVPGTSARIVKFRKGAAGGIRQIETVGKAEQNPDDRGAVAKRRRLPLLHGAGERSGIAGLARMIWSRRGRNCERVVRRSRRRFRSVSGVVLKTSAEGSMIP